MPNMSRAGDTSPIRSAILLDFDNIYLSLKVQDEAAAVAFANNITRWSSYFSDGLHAAPEDQGHRRLVLRRCYMNPNFGQLRMNFMRAGFQVVDCPNLTTAAKNAADIVMTMDILDLLAVEGRVDEFIILSSDADFTPVLHRIRMHGGLTTVFGNDVTVASLRNAADSVLLQDTFIEHALGIEEAAVVEPRVQPVAVQSEAIADKTEEISFVASLIREALRTQSSVAVQEFARIIGPKYPTFWTGGWLGYGSANALMEKMAAALPELEVAGEYPDRHMVIGEKDETSTGPVVETDGGDLGAAEPVLKIIREYVLESDAPVLSARVGGVVGQRYGSKAKSGGWFGFGSLHALVTAAGLEDLEVLNVHPGYLMNPQKHDSDSVDEVESQSGENLRGLEPYLIELVNLLHVATNWPKLSPAQHDLIFEEGAAAVRNGIVERNELSKEIRDRVAARSDRMEAGGALRISRSAANYVLTSILHSRQNFAEHCRTAEAFRQAAFRAVDQQLNYSGSSLDEEKRSWIASDLFGISNDEPADDQPEIVFPESSTSEEPV